MSDQPRPTPRTSALAAKYIASPHTAIEAKEIWVLAETLEAESDARAETIAALANNLAASDSKNASLRGEVKAVGEEIAELRRLLREATEALEKSIEHDAARTGRIAELENLATVLLGPCNPPLDCPHEELVAFINSLTPGERVIERGQSCMIGQTGTVILYDGSISVRWGTVFKEGTGMVTSVTGGTRRIESGSLLATKEAESAKLREALEAISRHPNNDSKDAMHMTIIARQALAGKETPQ